MHLDPDPKKREKELNDFLVAAKINFFLVFSIMDIQVKHYCWCVYMRKFVSCDLAVMLVLAFRKLAIVFLFFILVFTLFPLYIPLLLVYFFQHVAEIFILLVPFTYSRRVDECKYASITPFLTCIGATYILKFLDTLVERPRVLECTLANRRYRETILSAAYGIQKADEKAGRKILELLGSVGVSLEYGMEIQHEKKSILTKLLLACIIVIVGIMIFETMYYVLFSDFLKMLSPIMPHLREVSSTAPFVGIFAFGIFAISDYMFQPIPSTKREKLAIDRLMDGSFRQRTSMLLRYIIKLIAYHLEKPLAIILHRDYGDLECVKIMQIGSQKIQIIKPSHEKPEPPDISP